MMSWLLYFEIPIYQHSIYRLFSTDNILNLHFIWMEKLMNILFLIKYEEIENQLIISPIYYKYMIMQTI